ncbi:hypothetical protein [Streptomyces sp. NPDC127098]|uniref:hypothetical protein n=1 Tax=Streptomyces sp. NPDC127098 TaxID=3347137 RepID=UPI0036634142
MGSGLGEELLERLRARADARAAWVRPGGDDLPDRPTTARLRDVAAAVESRRAGAAQELAALLLAVDRDGDVVVLAEAERILLTAGPRLWTALDEAARRAWWHAPRWSADAVRRLMRDESSPLGLTVAASHPDGHVREAAVTALAELDDALALPALALRAIDWVPVVRDRSRAALERRLAEPSGEALVTTAAVALALRDRRAGRWLADRVEAVFREGSDEQLAAALAARDRATRRAAHLAALAAGRLDLPRMLHAAERDDDLPTRLRCAEAAVRTAVAAGTPDLVRPLLTNGTAMVRAEALYALARVGDVAAAEAALADRHPTVRAVAQAALRRAGTDPAARYRALVGAPHPAPGAIAGLGETGVAADADLVRARLDHPRPRGRAEAVRALRRLGATDPDTLLAMLTDPSGSVTRQVSTALRPWASGLAPGPLRKLVAEGNPWHVRMAAYRLLRERDPWTRLLVDLELVADPSPPMRGRARGDIAAWLAREAATTYSMPRGETADELAARLPDAADALGRERVRLLRFHLGLGNRPVA